jgi:stress response protein SCP2
MAMGRPRLRRNATVTTPAHRSGDQERVEHVEDGAEGREQIAVQLKRVDVTIDRLAHIVILVAGAREEFKP